MGNVDKKHQKEVRCSCPYYYENTDQGKKLTMVLENKEQTYSCSRRFLDMLIEFMDKIEYPYIIKIEAIKNGRIDDVQKHIALYEGFVPLRIRRPGSNKPKDNQTQQ